MTATTVRETSGDARGRSRAFLVTAIVVLLAAAGLAAMAFGPGKPSPAGPPAGGQPTGGSPGGAPAGPPAVTVVKPERKTLLRAVRQPGTVEAFERTPLYARVAGYVEKVHVDIGDRVRAGDVLAKLSVLELEEEVRQKAALVEQAKAEITQSEEALAAAEAGIGSAKAQIQAAEAGRGRTKADYARWQGEYNRVSDLAQRKLLDKQVVEETLNQFRSAEAARDETEAKVAAAEAAHKESVARRDKARADVTAAKARLGVAEADHRRMAAWLGYAAVRAPFDGVVTVRNVHTGHFLQPAASGSGGRAEPLFVVERIDTVRVFVEVSEADAAAVRDGTPAAVRVPALGGREVPGKVTRSSWSLEAKERTLRTEIDVPNQDGRLRPGMYAHASITVEHPNVLTLPASAVLRQGEESFCFRLEGGKAVRTPVKVGLTSAGSVEVVQKRTKAGPDAPWEEFTGGEELIVNPAGLTDGQVVRGPSHP